MVLKSVYRIENHGVLVWRWVIFLSMAGAEYLRFLVREKRHEREGEHHKNCFGCHGRLSVRSHVHTHYWRGDHYPEDRLQKHAALKSALP